MLPLKILSQYEPKISAKPKEENVVIDSAISDPGLLRKTEISLWSQTLRITKGEELSIQYSVQYWSERKTAMSFVFKKTILDFLHCKQNSFKIQRLKHKRLKQLVESCVFYGVCV